MTTIFPDVNDKFYTIKNLTYNITTKNYKIDTEKLETSEKVTFSGPPDSTNFAFIESIFMNPSPTKVVTMYQTIWIINTSLNELNGSYLKSTWGQQDAFESWRSLQVDTILSARRILYNYNLLDTGRKSPTTQIAENWESTGDNPYSHNSPNRRIRQPLCDSKKFQDAGWEGKPKLGRSSGLYGQEPW